MDYYIYFNLFNFIIFYKQRLKLINSLDNMKNYDGDHNQPFKLETAKNNATIFELELNGLINKHIKGGLSKPDLIAKLEYILKSSKLS